MSNQQMGQLPLAPNRSTLSKSGISRRKIVLGVVGGLPPLALAWIGGFFTEKARDPLIPPSPTFSPPPSKDHPFIYSKHKDVVYKIAWSPDGKRIASASQDQTVQVWDALTGNNPVIYHGSNGAMNSVAWSPNEKYIASSDSTNLYIWESHKDGTYSIPFRTLPLSGIQVVAWSPDGNYIAVAGGLQNKSGYINIYQFIDPDLDPLTSLQKHTNVVNSIAWSPDSMELISVSSDETALVWSGFAEKNYKSISVQPTRFPTQLTSVAWSPRGMHIVLGGSNRAMQVWDWNIKENKWQAARTYQGHSAAIKAVAWSPDGALFASGSDDYTVRIWSGFGDLVGGPFDDEGPSKVNTVAWSPDSKFIAWGSSGSKVTVQLWS